MIAKQFYKKVTGKNGAVMWAYDMRVDEAYQMRPITKVNKKTYERNGYYVERVTSESDMFNASYTLVRKPNGEKVAYLQYTNFVGV